MQSLQVTDCCQPSASRLERINFFNRQLLTANDMTTENDYFLQKLRRHNRFMHGWGVVCGLPVTAAPAAGAAWRVEIGPGYALGPYGDEIFVGEAVYFDLAACLSGGATDPCEPNMIIPGGAGTSTMAYLAIQYAECLARPVQVAYSGCGCDDEPCQYSRIRDSFQLQCLGQLPPQPAPPPTLCQVVQGGTIAPCPPCPTDPWVVLAKINLPSATTMNITNSSIDNVSVRRVILSAAVLQDQIIRCCCGPTSSSSSSSSSSTVVTTSPPAVAPRFAAAAAVLNIGQRATRIAGTDGAVQIAVTVMNSGARAAEDVVLNVDLSPELPEGEYRLNPALGWQAAALAQLKSPPLAIQPGRAQTFSFQIVPVRKTAAVTVTSRASAVAADPGVSATAGPIQATIGG
jgi:hypothetical protein